MVIPLQANQDLTFMIRLGKLYTNQAVETKAGTYNDWNICSTTLDSYEVN